MTASYHKHGLEFIYPENWVLTEDHQTDEFTVVALESPSGCIWSASLFPPETEPTELLRTSAAALRQQYQDFEDAEFQGQLENHETTGFNADFYCLDFLVTAQARVFSVSNHTILVFCQAESREFDQVEPVFTAMTSSLLRNQIPRQKPD